MLDNRPLIFWCLFGIFYLASCNQQPEPSQITKDITIQSSDALLDSTFNWAKSKARSYVQTNKSGKVDVWERGAGEGDVQYIPSYWAGYPGRSAFYSRDFCHQAIGAHVLGLRQENFIMLKAFAASADTAKKWYPLWAINFDGSPFKLDFRGNDDFVREVPAVFELVEKAYELFLWTGDERYIRDSTLWNYYTKAVTSFITLHDGQLPNGVAEGTGQGIFLGAASYNEQKDFPLIEAGDGLACQVSAIHAYAQMASIRGDTLLATKFKEKAARLKLFFQEDWGINQTDTYNRGYLADGTPIDGWGKENSWFLVMKGLLNPTDARTNSYLTFINERLASKDDIPDNIEALTYIPEAFFAYHQNELGWKWLYHIIQNLQKDHVQGAMAGRNGDYPEVAYVLVQNIVQDLMGLMPNASNRLVVTLPHLPESLSYLSIQNIPFGKTGYFDLQHQGLHTSILSLSKNSLPISWKVGFPGKLEYLFVDGKKRKGESGIEVGKDYTYCIMEVQPGESITVSITP